MKDNPLISIYMPTWNRQQLAIRAILTVFMLVTVSAVLVF